MKKVAERTMRQNGRMNVRTVGAINANSKRRCNTNNDSTTSAALSRSMPSRHTSLTNAKFTRSYEDLSCTLPSEPVYYPKYPQSLSEMARDPLHQTMSPIAPLHPPWRSHLPPIQSPTKK